MKIWVRIAAITMASWTGIAVADWLNARCDIYPRGEDKVSAMIPCTFGQRQGAVTITRSDGVTHNLIPMGDVPGNFRDQRGRTVYRQSGLGRAGQIFRLEDESVYVYWDTSALNTVDEADNPTAPYTTDDYDVTTLLRCGRLDAEHMDTCPAGILRMVDGEASIVITSPTGDQITINFLTDYVNATAGEVDARLEGDTWIVIVNGQERYEVPLAAIEGG